MWEYREGISAIQNLPDFSSHCCPLKRIGWNMRTAKVAKMGGGNPCLKPHTYPTKSWDFPSPILKHQQLVRMMLRLFYLPPRAALKNSAWLENQPDLYKRFSAPTQVLKPSTLILDFAQNPYGAPFLFKSSVGFHATDSSFGPMPCTFMGGFSLNNEGWI